MCQSVHFEFAPSFLSSLRPDSCVILAMIALIKCYVQCFSTDLVPPLNAKSMSQCIILFFIYLAAKTSNLSETTHQVTTSSNVTNTPNGEWTEDIQSLLLMEILIRITQPTFTPRQVQGRELI